MKKRLIRKVKSIRIDPIKINKHTHITPNKSNTRKVNINPTSIQYKKNSSNLGKIKTKYKSSNRVFIIGGGPSVSKIDFELLKNEDTICVNSAIDVVKNPTFFVTMDYSFFSKTKKTIKETLSKVKESYFFLNRQPSYITGIGNDITDTRTNLKYKELDKFTSIIESYVETNTETGFGTSIESAAHGNNSGYSAIQFAILAGYTEIYLIGFDLIVNRKTHFHKYYDNIQNTQRFKENLVKYRKNLISSLNLFKDNHISFFTLTKSPPLVGVLKEVNINNLDLRVNKDPIIDMEDLVVVAYYTVNTLYEQEAKKLISSLNKVGLNYDVVGVTNLGNWQANTRFKAKFMEDMLNKHTTKNLLYVDCDAIIHSKPVIFKNYKADIAVRWQDFKWRKNECLSGTIYMANNEKTKELCRRWQKTNNNEGATATTLEQWNLGLAIKEMEKEGKIIAKNLPPEYTMIFDSMRKMYPNITPVIEHFQASRNLKNKV